jgi:hypothetical protein
MVPSSEELACEWMRKDTLEARKLPVANNKSRVKLKVAYSLHRFLRKDCVHEHMYLNLDDIICI